MRNPAQVLKAVAKPFINTDDRDPDRDAPSCSVAPSTGGQLIDMAEWRLLPPVDCALGGAA